MGSFRPHEGDPSSLLLPWFALNAIHSFRPHEGDPSSLLHNKSILAWLVSYCFRPHEGDPSSLQLYTILSEVQNELFPSPRRGPIFSTENLAWTKVTCEFPSPRRGPIFSTDYLRSSDDGMIEFPSPRRGPIFSTHIHKMMM